MFSKAAEVLAPSLKTSKNDFANGNRRKRSKNDADDRSQSSESSGNSVASPSVDVITFPIQDPVTLECVRGVGEPKKPVRFDEFSSVEASSTEGANPASQNTADQDHVPTQASQSDSTILPAGGTHSAERSGENESSREGGCSNVSSDIPVTRPKQILKMNASLWNLGITLCDLYAFNSWYERKSSIIWRRFKKKIDYYRLMKIMRPNYKGDFEFKDFKVVVFKEACTHGLLAYLEEPEKFKFSSFKMKLEHCLSNSGTASGSNGDQQFGEHGSGGSRPLTMSGYVGGYQPQNLLPGVSVDVSKVNPCYSFPHAQSGSSVASDNNRPNGPIRGSDSKADPSTRTDFNSARAIDPSGCGGTNENNQLTRCPDASRIDGSSPSADSLHVGNSTASRHEEALSETSKKRKLVETGNSLHDGLGGIDGNPWSASEIHHEAGFDSSQEEIGGIGADADADADSHTGIAPGDSKLAKCNKLDAGESETRPTNGIKLTDTVASIDRDYASHENPSAKISKRLGNPDHHQTEIYSPQAEKDCMEAKKISLDTKQCSQTSKGGASMDKQPAHAPGANMLTNRGQEANRISAEERVDEDICVQKRPYDKCCYQQSLDNEGTSSTADLEAHNASPEKSIDDFVRAPDFSEGSNCSRKGETSADSPQQDGEGIKEGDIGTTSEGHPERSAIDNDTPSDDRESGTDGQLELVPVVSSEEGSSEGKDHIQEQDGTVDDRQENTLETSIDEDDKPVDILIREEPDEVEYFHKSRRLVVEPWTRSENISVDENESVIVFLKKGEEGAVGLLKGRSLDEDLLSADQPLLVTTSFQITNRSKQAKAKVSVVYLYCRASRMEDKVMVLNPGVSCGWLQSTDKERILVLRCGPRCSKIVLQEGTDSSLYMGNKAMYVLPVGKRYRVLNHNVDSKERIKIFTVKVSS